MPPWWLHPALLHDYLWRYRWPLGFGYAVFLTLCLGIRLWRRSASLTPSGHGSATFATSAEIRRSVLWQTPQGILLGWHRRHPLVAPATTNVLVVGPAGCGKTTLMEKTVEAYPGAVVVIDNKGRLTRSTSAARRRAGMGPVYVLDPIRFAGDQYNPHALIRWGPDEIRDLYRYADQVTYVDIEAPSNAGIYYRDHAKAAIVAATIYLHYSHCEDDSPTGLLRFFQSAHQSTTKTLEAMAAFDHPVVHHWAGSLLKNETETRRKEIWNSPKRWLMIWDDPGLQRVSAGQTIDVQAFQHQPGPATLYLRVPAVDMLGWLAPWVRLIIAQLVVAIEDRPEVERYHYPVLFVMDDVSVLGHFTLLLHIVAYLREFGGWTLIGAQSFGQLWELFSKETGLLDNMTTWVLFRPSSPSSAQFISDKLSDMTAQETVYRTTRRWGMWASQSEGQHSYRRPLATPGEIFGLGDRQMLICYKNLPTIVADRGD